MKTKKIKDNYPAFNNFGIFLNHITAFTQLVLNTQFGTRILMTKRPENDTENNFSRFVAWENSLGKEYLRISIKGDSFYS